MRTVGVKLTADVSGYVSGLGRAKASTADFKQQLDKAAKKGSLDAVADRAGVAGLALTGMAAFAIKSAADFDKAMSAVSAATHASSGEISKLRDAALAAGKDTQYSATEAAQGITELSKAGVSTASILNGGLKGALSLAAAGQLSVGEAAETAASAMTQFKLSGDKVPHVADLLAAAAGKAQGSVHDMGYALNQSGLVASQFGLSIEDTTGALAEFANAGLTGSDAGTSFKSMLLAMGSPSAVTKRAMAELGISFYDAQGQFIGLAGVADELRDKLGGLTQEQRNAALGQIYGSDAVRAATVLYKDGAKGVDEWKNKVNDAGYASETAAKLTDNLAGDLERLKGSMETLAIQSGTGANSGLRVLVKGVNDLVNGFLSLPGPVTSTITVLAGLSGGALILGAGWIKLRKTTADVRSELEALGPMGEKAASGMSKLAGAAGKAGLAFAALQAAGALIGQFQDDLNPKVEALAVGLQRFAADGKLAGEASRVLGDNLDDLKVGFAFLADGDNGRRQWTKHLQEGLESIVPGLDGTNTSLAKTQERINAMDAAMAQLVQGGNAAAAQQAFSKLAGQLAVGGVSMEEFRKQFPQYAAAVEVAGKSTSGMTGDVQKLAGAADSASGKVLALSKQIDGLFQEQMSSDRAALKLAQSTNDLAAELTKGSRTLSLNTAEGRRNRAAVLDQLDAIEAVRDAYVRGGATLDEANVKYGKDIDGLKRTMRQAGFTKKQIDDLVGSYKQLPSKVEGQVSAPGATKAKKELDLAYTAANHFAGPYQAHISTTGVPEARKSLSGLLIMQQALKKGVPASAIAATNKNIAQGFDGGGWTGPGSKYQPAGVVHADEFVIQKDARGSLEQQKPGGMDYMNRTGQWPGYEGGGQVWPFPTTAGMTRIPSRKEAASAVTPSFGSWPSSPGAQRGDSGVWRSILAMVKASGIPYTFGNAYRPGDPLWHGSGRAIDFMGYNQDRLAQFFLARQSKVLELIHRTNSRDYGITRGHYNAMPHQWPLHRNHLHIAMKAGGTITEPIMGVGASGRTYSFGENYQPERVVPNWQTDRSGGRAVTVNLSFSGPVGSQYELQNWLVGAFDDLKSRGRI